MNSDNVDNITLRPHSFNLQDPLKFSHNTHLTVPHQSSGSTYNSLNPHNSQYTKSRNSSSLINSSSSSRENTENKTTVISRTRLGHLKFYALSTTPDPTSHRNKLTVILTVPKPPTFQLEKWPPCSFFGLYTGHSGNSCATFLQKHLHKCIFTDPCFPTSPKQAIQNGFAKADSKFLKRAVDDCNISGAFAAVVLLIGNKCFVANTGVSKAVISLNASKTLVLSQEHTTNNPEEFSRVARAGGRFFRDFTIDAKGKRTEIGEMKLIENKNCYTRSFGDIDAKLKDFGGSPGVVTPLPYVKSFTVKEEHDFIMLGSEESKGTGEDGSNFGGIWQSMHLCNSEQMEKNITSSLERIVTRGSLKGSNESCSVVMIGLKDLLGIKSMD